MATRDADFEAFASQHRQRLRRAAYLMCGDWTHAEDVVQEALTKLYLAWPRVSAEQAPFAYASRIVTTTAVDLHRRPWRRERAVGDDVTTLAGATSDVDPTERLTLQAALRQLPRRQRQVIVLRFFLELSVAETAAQLALSDGSVKSHTSRAMARLNQLLSVDAVPSTASPDHRR